MTALLDGVRVLDFTQMMLGPFATQILGDLGADVIKVERPGAGEWERGLEMMGELLAGDSAAFLAMNRNKRSVALDLKHGPSRDALLELGRTCDVVVENFRPGVLARLGLGYEDFKAIGDECWQCKLCYIKCPYTKDEGAGELLDQENLVRVSSAQPVGRIDEDGLD